MAGHLLTRRKFLAGLAGAAAVTGTTGWTLRQARELGVHAVSISLPRLPRGFDGLRIAFFSDTHHGVFFPLSYMEETVTRTNALRPDLILLGGDYVYRAARFIPPVMEVFGKLTAPLGVFAVRGNHDNAINPVLTSRELARNGIREITNDGVWLRRGSDRLRLGGVDDFQTGRQDLTAALAGTPNAEPALLLTHNPDYMEQLRDPRVILGLCGHTHGGQVCLPLIGPPIVPSRYGQKFARGLAHAPDTPVFVTSGVGAIFPPVRFDCPPEIALLTLTTSPRA